MSDHYILGTNSTVPQPDSVVAALREAGHPATLVQTQRWHVTGATSELAIARGGTRVFILVSKDLHAAREMDVIAPELVEEMEEREFPSVRRLIEVRHSEHAGTSW